MDCSIIIKSQTILYSSEDQELFDKWVWGIHKPRNYYLIRGEYINGKQISIKFHRCVAERMGLIIKGLEVDHINRNSLDNRRCNLRIATRSLNGANRVKQTNNTSGFKGVNWFAETNRWRARLKANGKETHLGYFLSITEAAKAYDKAAKEHFGDFACLNFPEDEV